MKSHVAIRVEQLNEIGDHGVVLICERPGCGWRFVVGYDPTIEDVNTPAADHWAGHIVEVGDAVLRILRETVDDLRLRVVEILSDAQRVPSTPQDPVSQPAETVGADHAADLAERLQDAHRGVWTCADCGSGDVSVILPPESIRPHGHIYCRSCGYSRPLDPPPDADQVEIVDLPEPDPIPTTGAPKRDDAGFERTGEQYESD